ncbi:156_t:CDS:2 [Racocetra fulgida]|uniref:156_t:CDS:1 n=1 Tax=Racocetra fulgida TaxID=60492 RepID=A0A9N8Z1T3_9GLOM|nr:156_t:CDS:2 [Racocetra fulgida]
MSEIEHYVDPNNKKHIRFDEVKDVKLSLLPRHIQSEGKTIPIELTIGEAVEKRLRFRQHMPNEMAHYACDCWDAEIQKCVGCADRSAYDLTVHTNRTKEKLIVRETLAEPLVYEKTVLEINKKIFGPKLRQNAKTVEEYLNNLNEEQLEALKKELEHGNGKTMVSCADGNQYEISSDFITIQRQTITEHEYIPNVIEPSFGIGRILYSLIEHVYWTREGDEQRALHIAIKVDDSSNSIGRRYSRNDELGTPFAITIDFQSVNDGTVTLRERDSTKQIREEIDTILQVLKYLVEEDITWEKVLSKYPTFVQQELDDNCL